MSKPTTMDDLPRSNLSSSSNFAFNANPEPRTREPSIYNSIKPQLSSRPSIQRYETATLDGEFQTFPNSDDELPQADRIKSKVWKGFSGRNEKDYLRDSTYGGIMEDLEAFKEARTIKQEMENIASEINNGDRAVGE
jgi:hypothetical protein